MYKYITNTSSFKDVHIRLACCITLLNFKQALPLLPMMSQLSRFTIPTHDIGTCFRLVCTLLDARLRTAFLQIDSIHPFQFHPWFPAPFISIPFGCLMTLNAYKFDGFGCFWKRTQSTFRNFEWALLTGTNWPSWHRGWRRRSGLAKLKLCHTKRVRKGVGCFRSHWSHTGRESWIVLGCWLCYFMLPWRRNVRGMLLSFSFSLKLIEPTPDIAHYRKRV